MLLQVIWITFSYLYMHKWGLSVCQLLLFDVPFIKWLWPGLSTVLGLSWTYPHHGILGDSTTTYYTTYLHTGLTLLQRLMPRRQPTPLQPETPPQDSHWLVQCPRHRTETSFVVSCAGSLVSQLFNHIIWECMCISILTSTDWTNVFILLWSRLSTWVHVTGAMIRSSISLITQTWCFCEMPRAVQGAVQCCFGSFVFFDQPKKSRIKRSLVKVNHTDALVWYSSLCHGSRI